MPATQAPVNLPMTTLKDLHPGESRKYRLTVRKVIGGLITDQPEDLTGATEASFTVKESESAAANVIQKTLGSGVTVDPGIGGTALINVTNADSLLLSGPHDYYWYMVVTLASGERRLVSKGLLPVKPL